MSFSVRWFGRTLPRFGLGLLLIVLLPSPLTAQLSPRALLAPLPAGSFRCEREPVREIAGVQTPIRAKLVAFIGSSLPDSVERMVQVSLDSTGQAIAFTEVLTTLGGPAGASTATIGVRFENRVPGLSTVNALGRQMLDSLYRQASDAVGASGSQQVGGGSRERTGVAGQRVAGALRPVELVRVASLTEEMLARCR